MTLTPAYGRDYKSNTEAKADFDAGKDFILNTFSGKTYCSKQDLIEQRVKSVQIRYKKNTQVMIVKL